VQYVVIITQQHIQGCW